ncbi:hypothetical protein [[Limnothrix rosea] IAM M-220]|uniref:hypothetical protein n=1 Tax=[Limnothrix rosea] IAM M-220 TaxID=454133 RepID=UPI0009625416|nr:hypothetical protein [[Limnothrix rosea] IAM M-220]OKH19941.1 hypothetical protein NIES208_00230 [[Limnothrix rosea] IAM M-220]
MAFDKRAIRKLHRSLVPIMVAPLIITVLSGTLFQIAALTGRAVDFIWLLKLHKGNLGFINLEKIYPFLNGFGLLLLIVSGVVMWWTTRPRKRQST